MAGSIGTLDFRPPTSRPSKMNNTVVNRKTQPSNSLKPSSDRTLKSQHLQQLLKRCKHLIQFKQIHTQIIKSRCDEDQTTFLHSKLVESLIGSTSNTIPTHLDYAAKVFDEMSELTTFVFNTMIRGYSVCGFSNEGINLYIQMRDRGLEPDSFTYPFLLKACTVLDQGKGVHSLLVKNPGIGTDIYSQTSLVSFYSSCGDLRYARSVFDRMLERNVVSWTAMITGYVKHKMYNEGLSLFHEMQVQQVEINELTLVNVLSACAGLGAFEMGKWVHDYIDKNQLFLNPTLATGLIDMYVKCGYIDIASQVFDQLTHSQRSACTWNSIIGGLATHGYGIDALKRFEQMQMTGTKPDHITLIGVLCACTHSRLVEKGREYFRAMRKDFGIEPNIKHYGCLVDLLGRAGHLEEAHQLLKNMPLKPNAVLWGTLLTACCTHANVKLGETAMEQLIELEPFNEGNYVLMSNIYAAKERWNDVVRMRRFMKDRGIVKTPGCSSIEIDNEIHEFAVGDSRHPRSKELYSMLDDVAVKLKAAGYAPKTSELLSDANEERKMQIPPSYISTTLARIFP